MSLERPDGPIFRGLGRHDQDVVKAALRSGATRREVMGWLMASGATVGMAGSIVTGASEALAATPKAGGNLWFAWDLHGPSDTLDPILFTSSLDYGRGRIHYNSLCRFNDDLTVSPELATEWEANSDATEWTFKLRQGVEFHDGSKMTADDVVYSMMRHIGPDSPSKAKVFVEPVKEWVKVDNQTVKAVCNSPYSELPIALGTFHFKIVRDGTTDFQNPVGTGPFTLKEFSPGIRSVHVRNEGCWNDEGGPYVDGIEAFGITDSVARVNALISGDIQMCANLDPKAISQVEAADGVEVFSVPSGRYPSITAMMDRHPGNNPDFVLGLKHLQRRDRILKVIQKGHGDIANDQPIGPAYGAGYCREQEIRAYAPDRAKFLLNRSGITEAEIHVAEIYPGMTDICLLLQRECAKVGFDLKLRKVPNDGYWGAIWMKKPMNVVNWNMRPSATMMIGIAYRSDAAWNETAWKNKRFDQLHGMAVAETDAAKKYEMLCEMQQLISDHSGSLTRERRGEHVAYLAQSAAATFNPALKINEQVTESAVIHGHMSQQAANARARELYQALELPDPDRIGRRYPHQVSGGQLQRLMAAMALVEKPSLLVLDEPTTALDVTTQIEVLKAFKKVIEEEGSAAIYVTHDLAVVAQIADHIVVLYDGEVMEQGPTGQIVNTPRHTYTRRLMAAVRPSPAAGQGEGASGEHDRDVLALEVRNLSAGYGVRADGAPAIRVLRNVNVAIRRGHVVGVIGESGCGKSTLARVMAGLLPASEGQVLLNGRELRPALKDRPKADLQQVQFVFQMADTALNPRQRIGDIIGRPLTFYHGLTGRRRRERVLEILGQVELPAEFEGRYPAELSGGQKQRVNLARGLAANPEVLLCDEVTSALESIVGANVITLLEKLRRETGVSFVFISHDLSTVSSFADEIVVLYAGRVVEQGPADQVLTPPWHPYTRLLITSVPEMRVGWLEDTMETREALAGISRGVRLTEIGCPFFDRCPMAIEGTCDRIDPPRREDPHGHGHILECHREVDELMDEMAAAE